jgi:hypothetical protein
MDLRNVGILPQHYTASQPRRPRFGTVRALFSGENLDLSGRKKEEDRENYIMNLIIGSHNEILLG